MEKLTKEQVGIIKDQIEESVSCGNMYPNVARTLVDMLNKTINYNSCCKSDSELLPDVYLQELSKVEWTPQTQASLNEQLQILIQFANKLGLYDASDYLKK